MYRKLGRHPWALTSRSTSGFQTTMKPSIHAQTKEQETPIIQYVVNKDELNHIIRGIIADKIEEYETSKKERLLSKKQVAERIGVDRSTLWRWEKENYLVPIRYGKKVRYKESDIIEIEEGRR